MGCKYSKLILDIIVLFYYTSIRSLGKHSEDFPLFFKERKIMSQADDVIMLDDLIKKLTKIRTLRGNLPVTYSADNEGHRFNFNEIEAGVIFYAGNVKDKRYDHSLEPVSVKDHKNPNIETFEAVIIN